jgi:hypothetical protein
MVFLTIDAVGVLCFAIRNSVSSFSALSTFTFLLALGGNMSEIMAVVALFNVEVGSVFVDFVSAMVDNKA